MLLELKNNDRTVLVLNISYTKSDIDIRFCANGYQLCKALESRKYRNASWNIISARSTLTSYCISIEYRGKTAAVFDVDCEHNIIRSLIAYDRHCWSYDEDYVNVDSDITPTQADITSTMPHRRSLDDITNKYRPR
jgi:hypothetical protein